MAREHSDYRVFAKRVRLLLAVILALLLLGTFALWRIDGERVERLRMQVVDRFVPGFDWALVPVARFTEFARGFENYRSLLEENRELRRELREMRMLKAEAAAHERQNNMLRKRNNVHPEESRTFVTGQVTADSGSPFRQAVIVNVGARDGVVDGWAVTDGFGLVGRISGVGGETSRVILLTDPSSRLPVIIGSSRERAIAEGNNSSAPVLTFLDSGDAVRPGDQVATSGDGGVFPANLLVGSVERGRAGRLQVRLSADYGRLEFLQILRYRPRERISGAGELVTPFDAEAPEGAGGRSAAGEGDGDG